MSSRKSKKSFQPFANHLLLGIPTNIAVGPLGFRAALDVNTKGEGNRPRHCKSRIDWADLTTMVDDGDAQPSQIILYEKGKAQNPLGQATSAHSVIDGGIEPENDPTGVCP